MGKFYSQYGEDKWIVEHLPHLLPEKGFFVDIGAADGVKDSNTKYFEEKGWNGICVEPDPRWEFHQRTALDRRAIAGRNERKFLPIHQECKAWTGFKRDTKVHIPVECITLTDLLHHYNVQCPIDLLSIDTEGTEEEIWGSLHKDVRPTIVIIEFLTEGISNDLPRLISYMEQDNYELMTTTYCNGIFANRQRL